MTNETNAILDSASCPSQEQLLATIDFLEKLTDSNPPQAMMLCASLMAVFAYEEQTAQDLISEAFAMLRSNLIQ